MIRPAPALAAVSSADLGGAFRLAIAVAYDRLALPHKHRSNSIRCSGRAGLRKPFRYNEEGLGRETVALQTAVGLARLRSRRPVEAADATDDDIPGHGSCRSFVAPNDTSQAGSRESRLTAAHHCKPMGARALRPLIAGYLVTDLDRPGSLFWVSSANLTSGCWTAGAGRGSSATPAAVEPPYATRGTRWPPDDHAHHATARRACEPRGPQDRVRTGAPIPPSSTRVRWRPRLSSRSPRTRSGGTTSARPRSPGVQGSAAGRPCHDLRGNGTGQGAGAPPPLGAALLERHPAGAAHALGMWPWWANTRVPLPLEAEPRPG
jgi:hypothetical protein